MNYPHCKSPEGAGGGGEFSPHSSYPPFNCFSGNACIRNFSCKPAVYSGGGPQQFRITPEMGVDIQRILSALSSFVKDGDITISVEVEALNVLSKPSMVNGSSSEIPMKLMNLKFRVGDSLSNVSCEKQDYSHGLNVSNAVHGNGNGKRPDEVVGGKPLVVKTSSAGDIDA